MRLLFVTACVCALAACNTDPSPPARASVAPPAAAAPVAQSADVATLTSLTRILIDAHDLYSAAAHDSENQAYSAQLNQLAAARQTMTNAFQARVVAAGGAAVETGQAIGTAHRVLMEARTLGDQDTKVAVQEALRGENYLLDQLSQASANTALSASTRAFVTQYVPSVTTDRDRLQVYAGSLG